MIQTTYENYVFLRLTHPNGGSVWVRSDQVVMLMAAPSGTRVFLSNLEPPLSVTVTQTPDEIVQKMTDYLAGLQAANQAS